MNSTAILKRFATMIVAATAVFVSCDDDTATIGTGIVPDADNVTIFQKTYEAQTKSIRVDSVLATSETSYLGRITDPETNTITSSDFLAQFYVFEDYTMPAQSLLVKGSNEEIQADSADLQLYIYSYYGDSLNSMKIGVYELDTTNVLQENESYYTNIDPQQYLNPHADAIHKEVTFSVVDLTLADSVLNSSSHSANVRIKLPKSYGTHLLKMYYEHPEYFKDSYNFIRHVCPGFYVKTLSGNGTLLNIDISALSVYFSYKVNDSIYAGVQRMAATQEVIQTSRFTNDNLDLLLDQTDHTYLKSPGSIFTEVTLPIADILGSDHYNDTINSAKIIFPRLNNSSQDSYNLQPPTKLLMVRKTDLYSFFENSDVADSKTSYVTSFSATNNSYTFSNIGNLLSYCKNERNKGANILATDDETTRQAKYAVWDAANPDWNKVVILPVTTTYNTSGSLIEVRHDLGLSSTKLVGGSSPIDITVIYSRFNN